VAKLEHTGLPREGNGKRSPLACQDVVRRGQRLEYLSVGGSVQALGGMSGALRN
jgi:hypothetical protein